MRDTTDHVRLLARAEAAYADAKRRLRELRAAKAEANGAVEYRQRYKTRFRKARDAAIRAAHDKYKADIAELDRQLPEQAALASSLSAAQRAYDDARVFMHTLRAQLDQ